MPPIDGPHVGDGVDHVARAGLALRADHRGALVDAAKRLAKVRGPADERDLEAPLVDVMLDVGRGQHLGLVDVVDLERLQDLRLGEVADAALGHHGNRDGLLDLADHARVGHPRHPAVAANVGGHALERHHGAGAGVLGDHGLLGVDDVHDHAALEHLGEPALDAHRPGLASEAVLGHCRFSVAGCLLPHAREQAVPEGSGRRRRRRLVVAAAVSVAVSAAGAAGAGVSAAGAAGRRSSSAARRGSGGAAAAGAAAGASSPLSVAALAAAAALLAAVFIEAPISEIDSPAASCSAQAPTAIRIASSRPSHAQNVRRTRC